MVTMNGRIVNTTKAWDVFKEIIGELEKKQNTFKTIVVDLLEDLYDFCRLYVFDQLNIKHESEIGFGKPYDMIRTEFLSTLKRLLNLDYENFILISHEDSSKDVTKKSGDKITSIRPNIPEKVATKVSGLVDIVARVTEDEGERIISFKTDQVIYGGERLGAKGKEFPLTYENICKVYNESGN